MMSWNRRLVCVIKRLSAPALVVCTCVVVCLSFWGGQALAAYGPRPCEMQTIQGGGVREVSTGEFHFEKAPYTFTQAGGHPWAVTNTVEFATEKLKKNKAVVPVRDPKDIVVDLPAGFLGDPQAVPRCPLTFILANQDRCPTDTQVGVARLRWYGGEKESLAPIVN